MKKLEIMSVREMDANELKKLEGGAWLADWIEESICSCWWTNLHHLNGAYM